MEKAGNNYQAYAQAPAGTGPYKFDNVVPHERLELAKNADYWDPNRIPKQDRVVLLPMPEASTRVAALLSGQIDWVEAPPPDAIDRLKSSGMTIVTNVYPHTWPYLLNYQRGPFMDVRVRRAANYAVNRDEMVEMLNGVAVPSFGVFVPSQRLYGHPVEYKFDPAKATELLKAANCYPCAINIAISTSGSGQMQPLPMNELVKEQLEKVGFKVTFDTLDWNTVLTIYLQGAVKYPQYDGVNFSSGATDELNYLKTVISTYKAPNGANWGGYANPKVDELAERAFNTFDRAERDKLIMQIHEITSADAARVFIVRSQFACAVAEAVGVCSSPQLVSGHHARRCRQLRAQIWLRDIASLWPAALSVVSAVAYNVAAPHWAVDDGGHYLRHQELRHHEESAGMARQAQRRLFVSRLQDRRHRARSFGAVVQESRLGSAAQSRRHHIPQTAGQG